MRDDGARDRFLLVAGLPYRSLGLDALSLAVQNAGSVLPEGLRATEYARAMSALLGAARLWD